MHYRMVRYAGLPRKRYVAEAAFKFRALLHRVQHRKRVHEELEILELKSKLADAQSKLENLERHTPIPLSRAPKSVCCIHNACIDYISATCCGYAACVACMLHAACLHAVYMLYMRWACVASVLHLCCRLRQQLWVG